MIFLRGNLYSRENAVEYAKKYALHPNPAYRYFPLINDSSGDCTNFISQCLHAGGAPMIFSNKNPWWYKNTSWSISWSVANSLYWFLRINSSNNSYGVKGTEVDSDEKLELGDLIFLENINRNIFHGTIVTSFSGDKPLVSQHSFEALDIPYKKSWSSFKKHFIKISI